MRMQLSSRLTFVSKILFPAAWLSLPIVGTVITLVTWSRAFFPLAGFTLAGLLFFKFGSFPLKEVIARDHGLYINNLFEVEFVPWSQISEVYPSFGFRHVTLVLNQPCRFGKKIVFEPYTHIGFIWRHPVLEFLRVRCG